MITTPTRNFFLSLIAGAAFGFGFFKLAPGVLKWLNSGRRPARARAPVRLHVSPVEDDDPVYPTPERNRPTPPAMPRVAQAVDEQLEAKLDLVLSKVAKHGRASLTAEEN